MSRSLRTNGEKISLYFDFFLPTDRIYSGKRDLLYYRTACSIILVQFSIFVIKFTQSLDVFYICFSDDMKYQAYDNICFIFCAVWTFSAKSVCYSEVCGILRKIPRGLKMESINMMRMSEQLGLTEQRT